MKLSTVRERRQAKLEAYESPLTQSYPRRRSSLSLYHSLPHSYTYTLTHTHTHSHTHARPAHRYVCAPPLPHCCTALNGLSLLPEFVSLPRVKNLAKVKARVHIPELSPDRPDHISIKRCGTEKKFPSKAQKAVKKFRNSRRKLCKFAKCRQKIG